MHTTIKIYSRKIFELIIKTELFRNIPLVKFLNKYKEFVKSARTNHFKINQR